jgi:hypothetical protein
LAQQRSRLSQLYPILTCIISRKNGFINTHDITVQGKQMSTKKKRVKPKSNPQTIDLLELSGSKKTRFLKEAKEKLRQKLMEAKFLQSFAKTERVTINGQKIDFENGDLKGFSCGELTGP